jgi:hypothetical protein
MEYSKADTSNRIAKDMREKLRRYGSLSDKQITFLASIKKEEESRRAKATGTVPTGRQRVSGYILSVKDVHGPYGMATKSVLDLGGGIRVYGTVPASVEVKKGQHVEFTATFEQAKNDPLFGFWKRPTKFSVNKAVVPKAVSEPLFEQVMKAIA